MLARDWLSVSTVWPIRNLPVSPSLPMALFPTRGVPARLVTPHPAVSVTGVFGRKANQIEKRIKMLAATAAKRNHTCAAGRPGNSAARLASPPLAGHSGAGLE